MKSIGTQASKFLQSLRESDANPSAAAVAGKVDKVWSQADFGAPQDFSELRSRAAACERSVVQLFALVAQHCPEVLPGAWATLYDVIAAEERLWVYPSMTVGEYEDGVEPTAPFLSRQRLLKEWPHLVEHAHRVHAARETAERYRLTA